MHYSWVRLTTSGKVSLSPGLIGSIIITPDGDDDRCRTILYDGESANDDRIMMIRTLGGETKVIDFSLPLTIHKGLYVSFDSHVQEVLIQLVRDKE